MFNSGASPLHLIFLHFCSTSGYVNFSWSKNFNTISCLSNGEFYMVQQRSCHFFSISWFFFPSLLALNEFLSEDIYTEPTHVLILLGSYLNIFSSSMPDYFKCHSNLQLFEVQLDNPEILLRYSSALVQGATNVFWYEFKLPSPSSYRLVGSVTPSYIGIEPAVYIFFFFSLPGPNTWELNLCAFFII